MPPVNWLAGWVQLWFSIAITNTALISCALAFKLPNAKNRVSRVSRRGDLRCDIDYAPELDWRLAMERLEIRVDHRARNPEITTLCCGAINLRLFFDEMVRVVMN